MKNFLQTISLISFYVSIPFLFGFLYYGLYHGGIYHDLHGIPETNKIKIYIYQSKNAISSLILVFLFLLISIASSNIQKFLN